MSCRVHSIEYLVQEHRLAAVHNNFHYIVLSDTYLDVSGVFTYLYLFIVTHLFYNESR
jgi:hypothetical protein